MKKASPAELKSIMKKVNESKPYQLSVRGSIFDSMVQLAILNGTNKVPSLAEALNQFLKSALPFSHSRPWFLDETIKKWVVIVLNFTRMTMVLTPLHTPHAYH